MTPIIRRTMPTVFTRALDAFRAGDAVSIGEVFEPHAFLVSLFDPKLLRLAGVREPRKPVRLRGNLCIAQFYASRFEALQVTDAELHSEVRVGRDLAVICDFEAKLLTTGQSVWARCSGVYTLSTTGRKVESGRTICALMTPGWDRAIN
ncbi:MAG: hypothetical protein AB7U75_02320 [Hyphomicrobiaceae bacterium]